MKPKSTLTTIIFVLTFLSSCQLCFSDGCFIPTVAIKKVPDIPVQRALIKYRDGVETLIIEATFDGQSERFGWIIPIPGIPQRFERVSPGLLKTLSLQLEPEIVHKEFKDLSGHLTLLAFVSLFSLLFILKSPRKRAVVLFVFIAVMVISSILPQMGLYRASGIGKSVGVKVLSTQVIGSYEIFVLKAKGSADLDAWLANNGFIKFPEKALPLVDQYIDKKWCFVAAKLMGEEGLSTPHPILIEFQAQNPVYPIQLTALPGSTLYLELFVLAEKEAFPTNYSLKKEYCNIFDYIETNRDGYERFIGKKLRGHHDFRRRRGPLERQDEIGHPEAKKVMWKGCVVTKWAGRISSSEMKQDMRYSFKNAEPYRSTIVSYQTALLLGLIYTGISFLIVLAILTTLYRRRVASGSIISRSKLVLVLFAILLGVCVATFWASWVFMGPKTEVEVIHGEKEWEVAIKSGYKLYSLLRDNLTDVEVNERIKERYERAKGDLYFNPVTKRPFIVEDSPGNIAVVKNSKGYIIQINLYRRDGVPYPL